MGAFITSIRKYRFYWICLAHPTPKNSLVPVLTFRDYKTLE